jgi:hypothetical protein
VAKTLDDLVNEARLMMQDRREPYRYTDADILNTINSAFRELKRIRPDAFLSFDFENPINMPTYVEADLGATPTLTAFPCDEMFFMAVVFYTVGKLQLGDDEFAVDNRAMTLLGAFRQQLLGS